MTGSSTQGIKTVEHPVSDLATAKEVYAALLGVPPQTGFDPRALATPYRWFRISSRRIQAWREVNELPDAR